MEYTAAEHPDYVSLNNAFDSLLVSIENIENERKYTENIDIMRNLMQNINGWEVVIVYFRGLVLKLLEIC